MATRKKEEEETNPYVKRAREWLDNAPNRGMFGSSQGVAVAAVAEYLANLDGETLWPHLIKKDN